MNKGCGNCLPKAQAIFSLGNIVYKTGTHDFSQDESQDSHKLFVTKLLIIISVFFFTYFLTEPLGQKFMAPNKAEAMPSLLTFGMEFQVLEK